MLSSDINQNVLSSIYLSSYGRMMLLTLILWNIWIFLTGIFNFLNKSFNICQKPVKPNISLVGFFTGLYQMTNSAMNPLAPPPPPPLCHPGCQCQCQSHSQLSESEIEELVENRLSCIRVTLEEAQRDLSSIRRLLVRLDTESLLRR